ncbi:hypothetical protein T484DRAFT_3285083 [Baffinella frigidus]|nr:hypothetical protein T484DRAFT_3285083 [Cryptophyta sp. CCMP2293]
MDKLPSLSISSKKAAAAPKAPEPVGEPVGVGLGIKKNVHGDFMVTQVAEGGVAAASGLVRINDILQQLDGTQVAGIKSSALRDLILGQPGSTVTLVFSRWNPEAGGHWSSVTVTLKRAPSRVSKRAAAEAPAKPKAPVGSAVRTPPQKPRFVIDQEAPAKPKAPVGSAVRTPPLRNSDF